MFQGPIPELLGAFMGGMPTGLGVHVNFRQHSGQPGFRGQGGPFGQAVPNNKRKQAAKILNVSENATEAEIDKAYRNHAVKWHPDKHPPERKPLAKKKFEEGGKARDILKGKVADNVSGENGEQTVFANFANKVFEDFMRSSAGPQTEEDELDAEAEDLFEFLHGMDAPPPGHPHIFRFGPNFGPRGHPSRQPQAPPQQSREPLNFRVRIDLKDI
jgi:DnaJ-class molecular chaperone